MFAKNVGKVDRIVRIVFGLALIAGFFLNDTASAWRFLYLIGVLPLVTGLTSRCPAYSLFGISTCRTT